MDGYVDFEVIGRVLLFSLVIGLVVVGAFALGARSIAHADGARAAHRPATASFATAILCFSVSAVAVILGVWFVLDK